MILIDAYQFSDEGEMCVLILQEEKKIVGFWYNTYFQHMQC